MLSVREKIIRRIVNTEAPNDPYQSAIALERGVGVPESSSVHLSRQRLRGLLAQAVNLGIDQQIIARQKESEKAAAAFPPAHVRRGLRGLWIVCLILGLAALIPASWEAAAEKCGPPMPGDLACSLNGLPLILVWTLVGEAAFAGLTVLAYRSVVWVWSGFRRPELPPAAVRSRRLPFGARLAPKLLLLGAWLVPVGFLAPPGSSVNLPSLWFIGFPIAVGLWWYGRGAPLSSHRRAPAGTNAAKPTAAVSAGHRLE